MPETRVAFEMVRKAGACEAQAERWANGFTPKGAWENLLAADPNDAIADAAWRWLTTRIGGIRTCGAVNCQSCNDPETSYISVEEIASMTWEMLVVLLKTGPDSQAFEGLR